MHKQLDSSFKNTIVCFYSQLMNIYIQLLGNYFCDFI